MSIINRQQHTTGFTLIEVLVSLVVLAVGLLGLGGIHVLQMRDNQSAYHRSQATQLAYDMSDRMRANAAGVTAGYYNNQATCSPVPNCETNTCTSQQLACYDLARWRSELAAQLPALSTQTYREAVCLDSSPEDGDSPVSLSATPRCNAGIPPVSTYAIKIWWLDARNKNDQDNPTGTNCDGSPNNDGLQCFVMSFQP